MTGLRFGRWTVISASTERDGGSAIWVCRCDCGIARGVRGTRLVAGKSRGCGCARLESVTTHGHSTRAGAGSRTYRIWKSMILRCEAKGNASYRYYGARGIGVCERWRHSFENFLADMGDRPDGMSIDRADNDIGYEPGNCAWATTTTQNRHRISVKMTEESAAEARSMYASGIAQAKIAERFGVSASLISMIVTGRIWKAA